MMEMMPRTVVSLFVHLNPCPTEPGYPAYPAFANSLDPDQLASKEAS